jgi:hypothetical protein
MTSTDRIEAIAAAAREYRSAEIVVARIGCRSAGNAEDYDEAARRVREARADLDAALAGRVR